MDKKKENQKKPSEYIGMLLPFLLLILILVLLFLSHNITASSIKQEYETAVTDVHESVYNQYFSIAENMYHVSNKVEIKITDIEKVSNLEVFTVADTVFVKGEKPNDHIGSLINGHAYYTVNLSAGEFIVDNQRNTVYVRIPRPELGEIIIENNRKAFEIKNKSFLTDGSVGAGTDLAREFEREAKEEIYESLMKNESYRSQAKESAKLILKDLIIAMNPDVQDLKVEVTFYN